MRGREGVEKGVNPGGEEKEQCITTSQFYGCCMDSTVIIGKKRERDFEKAQASGHL